MKIRDLNNPKNFLNIFEDEQGDIYVTFNNFQSVRIGGYHSGVQIPHRIHQLFHELAHEFAKYGDMTETEACRIEEATEKRRWLETQISACKQFLDMYPDSPIMQAAYKDRLEKYEEQLKELNK